MSMWRQIPPNYVQVSEASFVEFLKTCPDYRRDSNWYYFAHNRKEFAVIRFMAGEETVFVDPSLLETAL